MRILSIGGGPAGLYFSILMKKAFPEARIRVVERNRADDTFGWGVVFSDETLGNFAEADAESFEEIRASFRYWTDIRTWVSGTWVRSTGHGFCGLSRKRLLEIPAAEVVLAGRRYLTLEQQARPVVLAGVPGVLDEIHFGRVERVPQILAGRS